jgi:hypothetical protein
VDALHCLRPAELRPLLLLPQQFLDAVLAAELLEVHIGEALDHHGPLPLEAVERDLLRLVVLHREVDAAPDAAVVGWLEALVDDDVGVLPLGPMVDHRSLGTVARIVRGVIVLAHPAEVLSMPFRAPLNSAHLLPIAK